MPESRDLCGFIVSSVHWPDTASEKFVVLNASQSNSSEGVALRYAKCTDGQWWIVQYLDGKEIAWHNPRYIETIKFSVKA